MVWFESLLDDHYESLHTALDKESAALKQLQRAQRDSGVGGVMEEEQGDVQVNVLMRADGGRGGGVEDGGVREQRPQVGGYGMCARGVCEGCVGGNVCKGMYVRDVCEGCRLQEKQCVIWDIPTTPTNHHHQQPCHTQQDAWAHTIDNTNTPFVPNTQHLEPVMGYTPTPLRVDHHDRVDHAAGSGGSGGSGGAAAGGGSGGGGRPVSSAQRGLERGPGALWISRGAYRHPLESQLEELKYSEAQVTAPEGTLEQPPVCFGVFLVCLVWWWWGGVMVGCDGVWCGGGSATCVDCMCVFWDTHMCMCVF